MELLLFSLWMFLFISIIHVITSKVLTDISFGKYLLDCFNYKYTAGGMLFGIFSYPFIALTHTWISAAVIFGIGLVITTAFIIVKLYDSNQISNLRTVESYPTNNDEIDVPILKENNSPIKEPIVDESIFIDDREIEQKEKENKVTELTTSEKDKEKAKNILGLNREEIEKIEIQNKRSELRDIFKATEKETTNNYNNQTLFEDGRPPRYVHDNVNNNANKNTTQEIVNKQKTMNENDKKNLEYLRIITGRNIDEVEKVEDNSVDVKKYARQTLNIDKDLYPEESPKENKNTDFYKNNYINDDKNVDIYDDDLSYKDVKNNNFNMNTFRKPPIIHEEINDEEPEIINRPQRMEQMVLGEVASNRYNSKPKYRKPYVYNKPPIELLNVVHNPEGIDEENEIKGQMLEDTLASFKTPAKIVSIKKGPAFSRFEMQMPTGIPVNKIINFSNDIAMALQSNGAIRMEIPIPGRNTFGIEVPNKVTETVSIRDIIESNNFQNSKSPLLFGIGKDITGDAKCARLDKLVHLLIAGTTGSGKSVCLNAMLISFIFHASPEDLKLILVDPKQVEFAQYNGIPHMLVPNVITEPEKAISMLDWACKEMDRRYGRLRELRVKNIAEYNAKEEVKDGIYDKMPYIIIILDEVGDLMSTHRKDIEDKIVRLGQKSRAAGLHLVVATQRPSVDVITGTIKANLPSRIAFAVTSFENSKTIIGCSGAENLLGKGDMLFSALDSPELVRMQGAFISNDEIENVVNYIKSNNECVFDSEIEEEMFAPKNNTYNADSPQEETFDSQLKDALRIVIKTNRASISGIQRALGVGFPKAGKLVDQMEKAGFISEMDSKNNRVIYITQQEFEERFGEDL